MGTFKRILFGGMVGVLAAMAFAIPAQANIKGSCVVVGDAKVTDKVDPALGVRLMGGKGTFTFNQVTLGCVGTNKAGNPIVNPPVTVQGTSGYFQNIVCGTGKAVGVVVATGTGTPAQKVAAAVSGKKFAVEFSATNGVFYWHSWLKSATPNQKQVPFEPGKTVESKNWQAAGDVHLSPSESKMPPSVPNTPPGNCTKAFHVEGTVAVDFA